METNTVNLKNFVIQFQDPVILAQEGYNLNNNSAPDDNPPGESKVYACVASADVTVIDLDSNMTWMQVLIEREHS